ncbi:hypothetical protein [Staphylococcus epidermidis]|uniref:hypothetical protein n=1 Tax=Staphylococcus epidermidis TaxID=1282 RepID=UPI000A5B4EE3|nr:hypothetical protein [Staphylococcus epidermidis]
MLEKATFFVLESRNASGLRGLSLAGNSYPYYQEKKKLVSLVSKNLQKAPFSKKGG